MKEPKKDGDDEEEEAERIFHFHFKLFASVALNFSVFSQITNTSLSKTKKKKHTKCTNKQ